jgi:hypothetical protein
LLARIRRPEEPFFQSGSGRCRALINRDVVAKKKSCRGRESSLATCAPRSNHTASSARMICRPIEPGPACLSCHMPGAPAVARRRPAGVFGGNCMPPTTIIATFSSSGALCLLHGLPAPGWSIWIPRMVSSRAATCCLPDGFAVQTQPSCRGIRSERYHTSTDVCWVVEFNELGPCISDKGVLFRARHTLMNRLRSGTGGSGANSGPLALSSSLTVKPTYIPTLYLFDRSGPPTPAQQQLLVCVVSPIVSLVLAAARTPEETTAAEATR